MMTGPGPQSMTTALLAPLCPHVPSYLLEIISHHCLPWCPEQSSVFQIRSVQFSSVQSLSRVRLFATPWVAAHQASLSIINSRSSLKLMSIRSVMPSSQLILCRPLFFLPPIPPSIRVFSNESTLCMRWPKYWSSALASFLPKKSQGWSPSEWTGWISLQSKGFSRVFSNTTVQKHQFFGALPSSQSNSYMTTGKTIALTRQTFVGKVVSLLFNIFSRLIINFPSKE